MNPAATIFGAGATSIAMIDVETTGTDPLVDRVVELAVVVGRDGGHVHARQSWLINPGMPIPAEASAVHGITDDAVKGAPVFGDVAEEILLAVLDAVPAAYNAKFDRAFVGMEFLRAGIPMPPWIRAGVKWLDPLVWSRHFHKYAKGGKKLDKTCERLGVRLEGAHRATADAEAALLCLFAFSRLPAPRWGEAMPATYGETIRLQELLDAEQQAEFAAWRFKQPPQSASNE